jgi:hypothetical protein
MSYQAMLAEMARLLAIPRTTHFSTGNEIDAATFQQVRAVLA